MINILLKKIEPTIRGWIAEAYEEGYKKCLTDVVERSQFIYEVIAETARQEVYDEYGMIDIPEATEDEWGGRVYDEDLR